MPLKDRKKYNTYMRAYRAQKRKERKNQEITQASLDALNQYHLDKIVGHLRQHPDYKQLSEEQKEETENQVRRIFQTGIEQLETEVRKKWEEAALLAKVSIPQIVEEAYRRVEEERKLLVETELRRIFSQVPPEMRREVAEKLLEGLHEFADFKKYMTIAVLEREKK